MSRMAERNEKGLTTEEMEGQEGTTVPDKEAMSLLDVNADLDLALDLSAPVDAAVAANANVAAPIDAAVSANVLSPGSVAYAEADQDSSITQTIEDSTATATANQDAEIDQAGA
jgi:hypothetical protein